MRFATTVGWIIIIISIIVFVVGLVVLAFIGTASGSPIVLLGLIGLVWELILGIYIGILGIRSDKQREDLDDLDRRVLKSTMKPPPVIPSQPKRPDYNKPSSVQPPVSTPASPPLSADELKKIMEARRREAEARRKADESEETA